MSDKPQHKIKVSLGANFRREATLIDKDGQVLAEGTTGAALASNLYGRRR